MTYIWLNNPPKPNPIAGPNMATAVTTPIENIKFSGDTLYVNLGLYFHYNLVFYSMWNN